MAVARAVNACGRQPLQNNNLRWRAYHTLHHRTRGLDGSINRDAFEAYVKRLFVPGCQTPPSSSWTIVNERAIGTSLDLLVW